jgi:NADP-dependent 3-hydroxy acid dehydrogenase YdfG
LVLFAGLWALYTWVKNMGWLPKKSVNKKHIFLTGAGSGLGRCVAIRLAKLGACLSLVDLNLAGLEETKRMIKA